jgi:hypothetical protein
VSTRASSPSWPGFPGHCIGSRFVCPVVPNLHACYTPLPNLPYFPPLPNLHECYTPLPNLPHFPPLPNLHECMLHTLLGGSRTQARGALAELYLMRPLLVLPSTGNDVIALPVQRPPLMQVVGCGIGRSRVTVTRWLHGYYVIRCSYKIH